MTKCTICPTPYKYVKQKLDPMPQMEPEAAGKVIGEKRHGLTRRQRVTLAARFFMLLFCLFKAYDMAT